MRNHRKIKALRNKFGSVQGYAFWVMMLEWLTEQDGIEWEYSELECEMFAAELGVSAAEIRDMVDFCIRIELLFKTDSGFIYSESLNEYLKAVFDKRQREREKSQTRKRREDGQFSDSNTTSDGVSAAEIPQSKVKYSKVNNSREKESKGEDETLASNEAPPTEKDVFDFVEDSITQIDKNTSLTAKENKASHTGGAREIFSQARRKFPGTKLGEETEWKNFEKKHSKDPEFRNLPDIMLAAIEAQVSHRKALEQANARFIPQWPHFQTWINQRRWEEELPEAPAKVIPTNQQSQLSSRLELANKVSNMFQYDEQGKMI